MATRRVDNASGDAACSVTGPADSSALRTRPAAGTRSVRATAGDSAPDRPARERCRGARATTGRGVDGHAAHRKPLLHDTPAGPWLARRDSGLGNDWVSGSVTRTRKDENPLWQQRGSPAILDCRLTSMVRSPWAAPVSLDIDRQPQAAHPPGRARQRASAW